MDLNVLGTAQESCVMELLHPVTQEVILDDKGKAFSLSLLSADTNKYKAEYSKVIKLARSKKTEQTMRESEERACELLAEVTTDCHLIMDGKKVVNDKASICELYLNPQYSWIREQVEQFMRDRSNFIKS